MPHFRTFDGHHFDFQGLDPHMDKPDTFEFAETIAGSKDPTPQEPEPVQTQLTQSDAPPPEDTFFFADDTKTTFNPPPAVQDDDFVI